MAEQEAITVLKLETGDSYANINELKALVKQYRQEVNEATINSEEYAEAQNKLNEAQTVLTQTTRQATAVQAENWEDVDLGTKSYNQLTQQMKALNAQWRETTDAEQRAQLGDQIDKINARLKDLDRSTGNYQRNVGNYEIATKGLREQMRELTEQMVSLKLAGKDNTAEYKEAADKLAVMKDAMSDVGEQAKNLASDTSSLDAVSKGVSSLMGVMSLLNFAMGENAKESEGMKRAQDALRKVMGALAVLTTLQQNLQKQGIIYQTALALKTKILAALKKDEAASTAADAAAKTADTTATAGLTAAQTALNTAMLASPLGWLVAALMAVAAAAYGLVKAYQALTGPTDEQRKALEAEKEQLEEMEREYENYAEVLEASGATKEEVYTAEIVKLTALAEAYRDYRDHLWEAGATVKEVREAMEKMAEAQDRLNGKLQDGQNYLDGVIAAAKRQAEKDALGLSGMNLELDEMLDKMDGLKNVAGALFDAGKISAQQYLAYLQQIREMENAEDKRIRGEYAQKAANDAKQRAKQAADAAYNAASKALEAEGKIEAERRKQRHANEVEEFNAKQDLERRKLELQRKYGKISEADYAAALELQAAQRDTFLQQREEKELAAWTKLQEKWKKDEADLLADWINGTDKEMEALAADIDKTSDQIAETMLKSFEERKQAQEGFVNASTALLGDMAAALEASEDGASKHAGAIKALRAAETIINTISGAMGAFMGITSSTGGWGVALAAVQAAAIMATGYANVRKILATDTSKNASSTSIVTSGGAPTVSAPKVDYTPQTVSNATGATEIERLNAGRGDQRVYVVYSDIAQAGRQVAVTQAESSFR